MAMDVTEYAQRELGRTVEILGVEKWAATRKLQSQIRVHEVLSEGLPSRSLIRAVTIVHLALNEVLKAVGVSERTYMRLKKEPAKLLDADVSGRLWQFAELLAKAEDVLGKDNALGWFTRPAMALENKRPIDMLSTPVGAQMVDTVLERIRYGVYQ